MSLGGTLIDMEAIIQDESSRRDWLINGTKNGYLGIVTIFENGSFAISEHSQDSDSNPVLSTTFGSCEESV